ncbi:MAG: hypothetical protein WCS27_06315 [Victivallaceae bacterium]
MKKTLICEQIGGSPQFTISAPEFMDAVLELDPALWAATSAPCESLFTDSKFIAYLDPDNSGSVRVDEVCVAIKFLMETFKSATELNKRDTSLALPELNVESEDGQNFAKFIRNSFSIKDENTELPLERISEKIDALSSGPLKGDGCLTAKALEDPVDLVLFNDILSVFGKDSLTVEMLDQFVADAGDFLHWEENTAKPELKVKEPALAYSAYSALKDKIDEFFSYCQLVAADPVNSERFRLDPDNIPPLELKNPQAVRDYLDTLPLAVPDEKMELKLTFGINSHFQHAANDFSNAFKLTTLSMEKWEKIKEELAPYDEYCARIYGDPAGRLGRQKLEAYLTGEAIKNLRNILSKDAKLSDTLGQLRKLEKLLLFRRFLPEFLDNFVNFKDLYTQNKNSMIQAGSLIMDGRHFDLTLSVKDPAEHKKYALKSNICMIYVELLNNDKTLPKQFAVAAVTAGAVNNLYIGKRGIFINNKGEYRNAVITDFVNGPISFRQAMFLPFRKAGEDISRRMVKLSSFNTFEQNLGKGIKTIESQPQKGSLLNAGSIAVLCGSVGVAALGSGIAFAINKLKDVSWIKITSVFLGVIILLMLPAVISALLKLRRRNLALFLEAAGWAVNQHLRLKSAIAATFTYRPEYEKSGGSVWIYYVLLIIAAIILAVVAGKILGLQCQIRW